MFGCHTGGTRCGLSIIYKPVTPTARIVVNARLPLGVIEDARDDDTLAVALRRQHPRLPGR
jgi:hypothetical protein